MTKIDGNAPSKSDIIGKLVRVLWGIILGRVEGELVGKARDEEVVCGGRRRQIRVV